MAQVGLDTAVRSTAPTTPREAHARVCYGSHASHPSPQVIFPYQQKENLMPDLNTALRKALDEWEPPVPIPPPAPAPTKEYFTVTNNVCRNTFNFVRDNPGMTRVEEARELAKQGYKTGSVSSLLGQMLKQGLMRESAYLLYATTNEYTPIKSTKALKALAAKPPEQQRKIVKIVNPNTGKVLNPTPAPVEKPWEPSDVIDKLSVRQALALFKELRNILVG
jgi:hypothetical protein